MAADVDEKPAMLLKSAPPVAPLVVANSLTDTSVKDIEKPETTVMVKLK